MVSLSPLLSFFSFFSSSSVFVMVVCIQFDPLYRVILNLFSFFFSMYSVDFVCLCGRVPELACFMCAFFKIREYWVIEKEFI